VLIGNRTNSGTDRIEVLATEATFEESLSALADVRNSTRGCDGGKIPDTERHLAALRLLAKTIDSSGAAGLPDMSWKLLETMFLDRTTMLVHQLDVSPHRSIQVRLL